MSENIINNNFSTLANNTPDIISVLKELNINTPSFSLDGYYSLAKVVSVYDGDTCKVIIPFKNDFYKWNVRLTGYDTPEMRPSRSKPNRDDEIKAAKAAKSFLKSKIMNSSSQLIYIKCGKFDKYGRLLAEIYTDINDNVSINQEMINNGHGYVYNGGTKRIY